MMIIACKPSSLSKACRLQYSEISFIKLTVALHPSSASLDSFDLSQNLDMPMTYLLIFNL